MVKCKSFEEFVDIIVDAYGTNSYYDNGGPEEDDPWVQCPECGEPIFKEDWKLSEVKHCCPICEYEWEI